VLTAARSIVILVAIAAVMYGGCCAALFAMQRSMIYSPQRKFTDDARLTFSLPVEGARVLVSSRTESGSSAVIYFGGNAEDVSESMPTLQRAFPDRSLFALHYRGYNGSTGEPSETALIADALVLFDRVHSTYPDVVIIGRSLGSGIAIHVASMRPVKRLVLVTPYDSLQEIAAQRFPLFPVRWLMLDKYESWRYAAHVAAPTLLLAAEHDEVIPRASTDLLYKHLPSLQTTLIVVPDAGHNTISDTTEYAALLRGPP
jgi:pimeloyl-ACP methyl ester carboxylesterase